MAFDEEDKKPFNLRAWLSVRGNIGYAVGMLVGLAFSVWQDFYIPGVVIMAWAFAALGRELATLHEFRDPPAHPPED